jgi:hypothetical protein
VIEDAQLDQRYADPLRAAVGAIPANSRRLITVRHRGLHFHLKFQNLPMDLCVGQPERRKLLRKLAAFRFPVMDGSIPMNTVEFSRTAINVADACRERKGEKRAAFPPSRPFVQFRYHRITPHSPEGRSIGKMVNDWPPRLAGRRANSLTIETTILFVPQKLP